MDLYITQQRLKKTRKLMKHLKLDALLVTCDANKRYLSGFTGTEATVLLTENTNYLITDFRYLEQAAAQAADFQIVDQQRSCNNAVSDIIHKENVKILGFESRFLSQHAFSKLAEEIKDVVLQPQMVLVECLRMIKDEQELALLRQAAAIADQAFTRILCFIRPGVTEKQVALELQYTMLKLGADALSFETIVASGVRGSLPHGTASEKEIAAGELVTMDFGCIYQGYCSDMTRTVAVGQANQKQKDIYHLVLQAQQAGVSAVKAGEQLTDVDKTVRDIITAAGYGQYFGHSTGHGVGLDVHEEPSVSIKSEGEMRNNMMVTIEPGIYLPGWGGVRIEDLVAVKDEGCEIFSKSDKQLIELI